MNKNIIYISLVVIFNITNNTALHTQTNRYSTNKYKHDNIAKMVISTLSETNINKQDIYNATPLMWAFYLNQKKTVKHLISKGAKLNTNGIIYKDRNFENYYGNILSIAISRDLDLLKYAVNDLKIPWNDQQYDLYTNKKTGHIALSSFFLNKLNFNISHNDPSLNYEFINSANYQSQFSDEAINEIIDKRNERTKLTENDIINVNYLIEQIPDKKIKKIYKNLLQYKKTKNNTVLKKIIEDLNVQNSPYLKILLVDLLAIEYNIDNIETNKYEELVTLSKKHYGYHHPKTISYTFNLCKVLINNRKHSSDSEKNIEKAEKLLWKCLKNRATRYGLYHSLTKQILDELSRVSFLKSNNIYAYTSNKYSRLANEINEKLTTADYGGWNYNQFNAFERQQLQQIGVDLNDFVFHSNYYNKRLKSLYDRIQSYFPEKQRIWSKFAPQKEYFDINFMIDYIIENFYLLKTKLALKDSNNFISEITNAYNAIYSYRKDVLNDTNYKSNIKNLDKRLINLQLTIKGANLNPRKERIQFNTLKKKLNKDEIIIEIVRYNTFIFPDDINYVGASDDFNINYIAYIFKENNESPIMIPLLIDKKYEDEFTKKINFNSANQKSIIDFIKTRESYNKVWSPLLPHIKNNKRIYLCPDGIFHQFPFDLLEDEKKNSITDSIEIVRVINSGNIIKLKQQELKNNSKFHAILVGNPDFNLSNTCNTTSKKTQPLPETIEEIDNTTIFLKNKGWNVTRLIGKNANEGFLKKINSPTILHIATHGNYQNKNVTTPFESFKNHYLKLAGCDCNKKNNNDDNGLLNGEEIQHINLKHTKLVILSACKTGNGSTVNAEGLLGLSKAFKIAGAESIISTLWNVNSNITVEFMKHFYDNFTQTKNKLQAFKYAKKNIKQNWGNEFSSGYILIN